MDARLGDIYRQGHRSKVALTVAFFLILASCGDESSSSTDSATTTTVETPATDPTTEPSTDAVVDPTTSAPPDTPPATEPSSTVCDAYVENSELPLKLCHQGSLVAEVQRILTGRGLSLDADGLFGPATEAAVRQFQTDNGLDVNGMVDQATYGTLDPQDGEITPDEDLPPEGFARLGQDQVKIDKTCLHFPIEGFADYQVTTYFLPANAETGPTVVDRWFDEGSHGVDVNGDGGPAQLASLDFEDPNSGAFIATMEDVASGGTFTVAVNPSQAAFSDCFDVIITTGDGGVSNYVRRIVDSCLGTDDAGSLFGAGIASEGGRFVFQEVGTTNSAATIRYLVAGPNNATPELVVNDALLLTQGNAVIVVGDTSAEGEALNVQIEITFDSRACTASDVVL